MGGMNLRTPWISKNKDRNHTGSWKGFVPLFVSLWFELLLDYYFDCILKFCDSIFRGDNGVDIAWGNAIGSVKITKMIYITGSIFKGSWFLPPVSMRAYSRQRHLSIPNLQVWEWIDNFIPFTVRQMCFSSTPVTKIKPC